MIEIYTDGACSGNPGPGGFAALLRYHKIEKEITGFEKNTTNNRMELRAIIEALKIIKKNVPIIIYTDSTYVIYGITKWIQNWAQNNWYIAEKKKIKNIDLWKELFTLTKKHTITWQHIRGHTGHPDNERVDSMARQAITLQKKNHELISTIIPL